MTNNRSGVRVEARFDGEGRIHVRRVHWNGRWTSVEQGRQFNDADGQHVLILLAGRPYTITLLRESLTWRLVSPRSTAV